MNFTNEFHIDSTELGYKYTLREEETRLNKENIQ